MIPRGDQRIPSSVFGPARSTSRQARLVHEALEVEMARFCLSRQHDRAPVTVFDIIDFLTLKGASVDRFWVRNFVQRQKEQLCFQISNGPRNGPARCFT
jgi:hypothetical protein